MLCTRLYYRRCPVICEIHEGLASQGETMPEGITTHISATSIVSDLHHGLDIDMCSWLASKVLIHDEMYIDKNIHILLLFL